MMKAILCLSFVFCFVAVALATCECGTDMVDCASEDANKNGKIMTLYTNRNKLGIF